MSLSSSELDRLATEVLRERRIPGSVYCGYCGYNLRTLPYIHTCPECGSSYNARPRVMEGIFNPAELQVPLGDTAAALVFASLAFVYVLTALASRDLARFLVGAVFLALAITFAFRTYDRLCRFLRMRRISRQIAGEE